MNQFSNTQQALTTAGYDELRSNSVSNKLSPNSILRKSNVLPEAQFSFFVVAAFCANSVGSVEGVWGKEYFDIYGTGEGKFYLTDRMTRIILQMLKAT
jgi:hypothetical protein